LTQLGRNRSIAWMNTLFRIAALGLIASVPACRQEAASSPAVSSDNGSQSSQALASFPTPTGRIVDAADFLTPKEEEALLRKLNGVEEATKHQFVVVTLPNLQGQDIAPFTRDLGRHWGIGRKDYDDGLILLVAPNERQVRIAVGDGLESTLTASVCDGMIRRHILPRFRQGEYPAGIASGVDAIIAELS
jgi:uncharacterized protein